ncbi:MAG: hypothetical protein O7C75_14530 [Verrucomicrobia bacterium]|nr:hypothetical protein [Verrucomicrobiota bacterium]
MKNSFFYTRWLLALTFCCLVGLLAVGMMTVHSKRTIRTLAVNLDRKEAQLEELGRRQDILDTDLASSLTPEYLKELIAMSKLRLGPPREDRIIIIHSMEKQPENEYIANTTPPVAAYRSRLELVNNDRGERE